MKPPAWPRVQITTVDGTTVPAIAPFVISVSRATDIPGLMSSWFMDRLEAGYFKWVNPFSGKPQFVSFENVRVMVFWSKYPAPLLPHLRKLHDSGIGILFQLTINDYEREGFEPGIPPLEQRIATAHSLSEIIGKDQLFWRFDPLILTRETGPERIINKIDRVGSRIADAVSRLTVSFLSPYRFVVQRMRSRGITALEPSAAAIEVIGCGLAALKKKWGIDIVTCAEKIDLSAYGILPGSCIDPAVVKKMAEHDPSLTRFFSACSKESLFDEPPPLRQQLKDPGQRPLCGCMVSKDIGRYGTCTFGCVYCYARGAAPRPDSSIR